MMTDAAKNVEIEDVLASIRRLVSDEVAQEAQRIARDDVSPDEARDTAPPQPAAPDHAAPLDLGVAAQRVEGRGSASDIDVEDNFVFGTVSAEPAAPVTPDALVLTPSLRVHGNRPETSDDAQDDAAAEDGEVAESTPDAQDDTEAKDENERDALLLAVAEQVAQSSQSDPDNEVDIPTEESADAFVEADTFELIDADAWTDDDSTEPEITSDDSEADLEADVTPQADAEIETETETETLEAKIAQLETMIAQTDGAWEVEDAKTGDAMDWEDVPGEPASDAPGTPADTDVTPEDVAGAPGDTSQPLLTPVENDGALREALSVDTAIADAAPIQEPLDQDGPGDVDPDVAPLDLLAEPTETYIDEDMLRDLVANIVREELQGALGERITRNVRKLVRREIHRALASHELD